MHLPYPVAQRVHDQLQDAWVGEIERVATAAVVLVARWIVRLEAIVARVVDSAKGYRRAELIGFGGVVIDDVQDDFDTGCVQRSYHLLEFGDRRLAFDACGIARFWREEGEGVVAPIVGAPALDQPLLVEKAVDRQQIDGGNAEALQVFNHRLRCETGIGAAQGFGNIRVTLCCTLDVNLVEHRIGPRDRRRCITFPVEIVAGDTCPELIGRVRSGPVGKDAGQLARVRVEQQALRIEAMPGTVRAMNSIGVLQAGGRVGQIAVPDLIGTCRKRQGTHRATLEYAQVHVRGVC